MSILIRDITFDCADPRRLAEFWAAVTGFEIQYLPDGPGTVRMNLGGDQVTVAEEFASIRSDVPLG